MLHFSPANTPPVWSPLTWIHLQWPAGHWLALTKTAQSYIKLGQNVYKKELCLNNTKLQFWSEFIDQCPSNHLQYTGHFKMGHSHYKVICGFLWSAPRHPSPTTPVGKSITRGIFWGLYVFFSIDRISSKVFPRKRNVLYMQPAVDFI